MTKLRQKKKGFTMIEVLVVMILVSTTFMGIISAVISTTNYLTATRQKVTALNLAKEGVEVMYNIRNSNWRRWANLKDEVWLKPDPLEKSSDPNAVDDPSTNWIYPGRWIIKTKKADGNKYFTLERIAEGGDMSGEDALQRDAFKLQEAIFGGTYLNEAYKLHFLSGNWYNSGDLDSFDGEDISVGEYRRYIAVDGLYKKTGSNNNKLDCRTSTYNVECNDGNAKELRFCSVVVYTRPKFGTVEICAIMTNFEK